MVARSKLQKLIFSQVLAGSNDFRGKLYQFDMHVRRVTAYDDKLHFYNNDEDPHEPVQLYEMWGDTGESRGRLIQLVVYDPPAGMPIGPTVQEDVRFVGYFFKLQGYEPARAAPGALPLKAPTFIGRVLWMERPPAVLIHQADVGWLIAIVGGVLAILLAFFAWLLFFRKTRPNVAQIAVDLTIPSVVSIDDWLDHPGPGGDREGPSSQDDAPVEEEIEPGPTRNGHGNGHCQALLQSAPMAVNRRRPAAEFWMLCAANGYSITLANHRRWGPSTAKKLRNNYASGQRIGFEGIARSNT